MKRIWRKVLLPKGITLVFFVVYLLTYNLDLLFIRLGESAPPEVGKIRMMLLVFASGFYGYYRVRAFHPFYNRQYWQWLCLTPWSIDKPLPRGPVHLIWADLITLGSLTVLAYSDFPFFAFAPAIAFFAVYLVSIFLTFEGEQGCFVVLCLFLAPFAIYPFANLYIALLVLILLYCICWFGLRQFLRDFPWNTKYWKVETVKELKEQAIKQNVIGWPFRYLNIYEIPGISVFDALLWSLLLTWWLHVIQWVIAESFSLFWIGIIALFVVLIRTGAYACEYRPPISLMGRIFTGRLIIPRYDKIFIAPICTLLAGTILPLVLRRLGLDTAWNFKLCFFLIFFLSLSLPPTWNEWRFTGAYRVGRLAQSLKPKPPSTQDQAINTFLSNKFKSLKKKQP
jgi:hypothetical protein